MTLNKVIVHELIKIPGNSNTSIVSSNQVIPVNAESIELVEALLGSYKGDQILYANFDESPGKYFPERYSTYSTTNKSDQQFTNLTIDLLGNLETLIGPVILAKGGYLLFAEYHLNGIDFFCVFLIRDTEGKLLQRNQNSFTIQRIEYLDTNDLAMACRLNNNKYSINEDNHLSFTRHKQQVVSDYFINWVCATHLESSTEYTNSLYDIINALPPPINPDTNSQYSIDEVRQMVYENARNNSQRNVNLRTLSDQIYGSQNTIIDYAEENDISIDTEFRFNKRSLKKFIQLHVNKDGINLKLSRGDIGNKVRTSTENPNVVIIESQSFAEALRAEMNSNNND